MSDVRREPIIIKVDEVKFLLDYDSKKQVGRVRGLTGVEATGSQEVVIQECLRRICQSGPGSLKLEDQVWASRMYCRLHRGFTTKLVLLLHPRREHELRGSSVYAPPNTLGAEAIPPRFFDLQVFISPDVKEPPGFRLLFDTQD